VIGGMKPLDWPVFVAVYEDGTRWTVVARDATEARDRAERRREDLRYVCLDTSNHSTLETP